jgi:hypothetical protein
MSTVGRVGALAVALGVGGMFGQCAVAGADGGGSDAPTHSRSGHTAAGPRAATKSAGTAESSTSVKSVATVPSIGKRTTHAVAGSARTSKSTATPSAPDMPTDTLAAAAFAAVRRADQVDKKGAASTVTAAAATEPVYYDDIVTTEAMNSADLTPLFLHKADYTLRDGNLDTAIVDIQAKDDSGNFLELSTYTVRDQYQATFVRWQGPGEAVVRSQDEVDIWVIEAAASFEPGCQTNNTSCTHWEITAASKLEPTDRLICATRTCDYSVAYDGNPPRWFAVKKGLWDDVLKGVPPIGGDQGDVEAPTPPTLTATDVTATTVTLLPSGSSDNVAVVGYDIYRDGILLTYDGLAAGETFVDSVDPAGSYTYYATAYDAARNYSDDGASITVANGGSTGGPTDPDGGGPTDPGGGGPTDPGGGGPTDPGNGLAPLPAGMEPIDHDIPTYIGEAIKRIAKPLPKILRQPVADAIEALYRLSEAVPFLGTAVSIVDIAAGIGEISNAVIAHDNDRLKNARYDLLWSIVSLIPGVGTVNGLVDQTADFLNLEWISTGKEWTIHRAIDGISLTHKPDSAYLVVRSVDLYIQVLQAKEGWSPD